LEELNHLLDEDGRHAEPARARAEAAGRALPTGAAVRPRL